MHASRFHRLVHVQVVKWSLTLSSPPEKWSLTPTDSASRLQDLPGLGVSLTYENRGKEGIKYTHFSLVKDELWLSWLHSYISRQCLCILPSSLPLLPSLCIFLGSAIHHDFLPCLFNSLHKATVHPHAPRGCPWSTSSPGPLCPSGHLPMRPCQACPWTDQDLSFKSPRL